MQTAEQVKTWIEQGLPGAEVEVMGDGRHFEATVVHAGFEGKTMIVQHRMVYDALGDKMQDDVIHALSLKTAVNRGDKS